MNPIIVNELQDPVIEVQLPVALPPVDSFSLSLACEEGVKEALLLNLLAEVLAASPPCDHKIWLRAPVADLQCKLPYLSSGALHSLLKSLTFRRLMEIEAVRQNNRTLHLVRYSMPPFLIERALEEPSLTFSVPEARELGLNEAVLIQYLRSQFAGKPDLDLRRLFRLGDLTLGLPFTKHQLSRALRSLKASGLIENSIGRYRLSPSERKKLSFKSASNLLRDQICANAS